VAFFFFFVPQAAGCPEIGVSFFRLGFEPSSSDLLDQI